MTKAYLFLERRNLLLAFILLVSSIVFFHRLNDASLSGDGTHYSEIAKEMFRAGNYLTPLWDYNTDFSDAKPPLLYWMLGISGKIFGFNNFAMKLPAAALGFLGVLALFLFANHFYGRFVAFISALTLTFTQQYLTHARDAVTDCPFAVFFALALMSFWVAFAGRKQIFYYFMGLSAGLAVMTRQIPGLFVFFVIFVFIVSAREFSVLRKPHFYGGILLSLAVFLPWHMLMYQDFGTLFIKQYFGKVASFGLQGTGIQAEYFHWYNYLSILISNYWPWLPFMVVGVYITIKEMMVRKLVDRPKLFILSWAFVPFLIFQMARVKATQYIVPVYFPFAILTAFGLAVFAEPARVKIAGCIAAIALPLAFLYVAFPIIPLTLDSAEYRDTILLVPAVRSIQADRVFKVGRNAYWHYANGLMFYADKKVVEVSDEELKAKMLSSEKFYMVSTKEEFERIRAYGNSVRSLAASRDSVLLSVN
jgi:4-amino-4-deoxy-L-arabinose transferase-like glycosyltransferase